MISSTLNQYKQSFKTNLEAFLNEYEDNTTAFFLEKEKTKYKAYQKALTKIADQIKLFTSAELDENPIYRTTALDLKKINLNVYNSIVTELNPVKDGAILSLSAAKNDKIKIDEIALENHIKSSILILKFISKQDAETKNSSPFSNDSNQKEVIFEFQMDDRIDNDLNQWLTANENKFGDFELPTNLEEKAAWVIDTYKSFEKRYFQYQISVCNEILNVAPNEVVIINLKKKFENTLVQLQKHYPIPSAKIEEVVSDINNAFFRLENFMKGTVPVYQSFLFNDAFTKFFNELYKIENINPENFSLRDGYYYLLTQIDYAYDKSEFKNQEAYKNEDFNRDCNEISDIHNSRAAEFGLSTHVDDYKFELPSILNIVTDTKSQDQKAVVEDSKQEVVAPVHTIELNIENLFSVGLTRDILLNNFEEWVLENRDIKIDFDNNLIYVGIGKLRKDVETNMMLLRKECAQSGMSDEEITNHFENVYSKVNDKLKATLNCFDDEEKQRFLLKSMAKMSGQVVSHKNMLIENEIEQLFNFEDGDSEKTSELNSVVSNPIEANPYPRIFTSPKAFDKFQKLLEEFGNGDENLANYSFVYHRMVKDKFIYEDYKQTEFMYFLLNFDINIKRIKPKNQLGKNDLRESIYNSVK